MDGKRFRGKDGRVGVSFELKLQVRRGGVYSKSYMIVRVVFGGVSVEGGAGRD